MTNAELIALYKSIQASSDMVLKQINQRDIDWQHLAEYGLFPQAVLAYRKQHGGSLMEAHEAVHAFKVQVR